MSRIVIISAILLASVFGAQVALAKAQHHTIHRRAASDTAECIKYGSRVADVIDANPYMGANMRVLAQRMRRGCIPSAPPSPGSCTVDPYTPGLCD